MQNNSQRATSLSKAYLEDATIQNVQQIDEFFDRAQEGIQSTADLYELMLEKPEVTSSDLKKLQDKSLFDYIDFADVNGRKINSDGEITDVSDKTYFIEGMKGNSGVDVVLKSDSSSENFVFFYEPLYYNNKIIGVLMGHYKESELQSLLYNTFFDSEARTFICMRDGTVIASNNKGVYTDNILDRKTLNDGVTSKVKEKLTEALKNRKSYEFQYTGDNGVGNAYVMPLEKSDWIYIQTFPSGVTTNMQWESNLDGIILLGELVAIFVVCVIGVIVMDSVQKKKLMKENIKKSYVVDGITHIFQSFTVVNLKEGTYQFLAGENPRQSDFPEMGDYQSLKDYLLDFLVDEEDRKLLEIQLSEQTLQKKLSEDMRYLRYEYQVKSDEERWDSINIICLKYEDSIPTELLFAYQDVTNVKLNEKRSYEALKEAYRAVENANEAKSNFLSNMSHDIRTPMNAIMGMTAIAAMNINNQERVKDCLNKITISSQHLLGLINEVLDMSKIESGRMSIAER
jgi:hypothetical protein